ncbi:MAG: Fe-S cluster assembly protein SufD [Bdellovibrionales bacterium]|nr:Fe-S cluster assembly protein SufD [Bdellovibrionales bacterium]MBT3526580.1 Fe-S cluster assembly protein SufD [Bdellovibrionales bacterium]MBT7670570.1 Fe-S cluster assembly protein SufD [Bdellovibrionales bacterium]MBT7768220.1 Fe-S cluster assembly protein SufD [Bdellovibrionales bacterium]
MKNICLPQFDHLQLPPLSGEQWKYTKLSTLIPRDVLPGPALLEQERCWSGCPLELDPKSYKVVLLDGQLAMEHTTLPAGVEVSIKERTGSSNSKDYFEQLNSNTANSEVLLTIKSNQSITSPLYLIHQLSSLPQTLLQPRVTVEVGANSKLTIHELLYSLADEQGVGGHVNSVTKFLLEKNANVEHLLSQVADENFHGVVTVIARLRQDASLNTHFASLGSSMAVMRLDAELQDEGAQLGSFALYSLSQNQHHDFQTIIKHLKPHTSGQQLYKGVMKDQAHGIFSGKIEIAPGAHHSESSQYNHNMLLSEKARADSRPTLDVLNDDVKCGHGATVGQLSSDSLFYCQGRGINPERATAMLRQAFLLEVLAKLESQELKQDLLNLLSVYTDQE